jgi:hypothetical protein
VAFRASDRHGRPLLKIIVKDYQGMGTIVK